MEVSCIHRGMVKAKTSMDWIKVKAIRIKNGKLQLKNPTTYYGGTRADKASLMQELFGTKTVSYRDDFKRKSKASPMTQSRVMDALDRKVAKTRKLSKKEADRIFGDLL